MPVDLYPRHRRKRAVDLDGLVIATLGGCLVAIIVGLAVIRPHAAEGGGPEPAILASTP